jgi:hypothetical protein
MDTQMWGPLVWDILAAAARAYDALPPDAGPDGSRARARRAFLMLAYSLRQVLPCSFCRNSYRHYIEEIPPAEFADMSDEAARARAAGDAATEAAARRAGTLVDWVWTVHDRVNRKLAVVNMLTRPRFRKRMRVTSFIVHPAVVWDLLTIVALNYPDLPAPPRPPVDGGGSGDVLDPRAEWEGKRAGHAVFLAALERVLPAVPDLDTVAPYIGPVDALRSGALVHRRAFVAWVCARKRRWMRDARVSEAVRARMIAAERAYIASVA